jgi:hypothetical protein
MPRRGILGALQGVETMSGTSTDSHLTAAILAVIEEARGRGISDEEIIDTLADTIEGAARGVVVNVTARDGIL